MLVTIVAAQFKPGAKPYSGEIALEWQVEEVFKGDATIVTRIGWTMDQNPERRGFRTHPMLAVGSPYLVYSNGGNGTVSGQGSCGAKPLNLTKAHPYISHHCLLNQYRALVGKSLRPVKGCAVDLPPF